jgi:hypothetical protein
MLGESPEAAQVSVRDDKQIDLPTIAAPDVTK